MSTIQQCIDCPSTFEITDAQAESFNARFGALPKRCRTCRAKKKDKVAERDRRMASPLFHLLPEERQRQIKNLKF